MNAPSDYAYQEYTQKNKGRSKDAEEALARGVMLIFSDFGKCKDIVIQTFQSYARL